MKVFLSWSGDRSKAIAEIMRNWLPSVLQAVRPYFSPDDVSKGSRWSSEIAKELEASRIALLFITPENPEAPWLVFEAGALSKNLDRSKVCPLLFGNIDPTDIKGPLVQFQAAKFDKVEMKRVLKMINTELGEAALNADDLESVFEMWWPKLDEQVSERLREIAESDETAKRPDRDLLEEILGLTRRNIRMEREDRLDTGHPAFRELVDGIIELLRGVAAIGAGSEVHQCIPRIISPLTYLIRHGRGARFPNIEALRHLEELRAMYGEEAKLVSVGSPAETSVKE
ncbi:hypothetical protein SBA5_580027 [Candidatus Sulfotelmatomonas gaucii]|uniref:TIR domain-containing protein n=1 Tax=Candidatus Sulfuritelmatomonas gaucii TaxID=2043161 RepID=A0A2N9LV95_9BACT|nr:hypothetical protein SBA5_580027 [Candidatus Sulfotelmatomonas gaucii]